MSLDRKDSKEPMDVREQRQAAAWTARWCRLAELTLAQLEAIEFDERMSQLGEVETLGLGLFTALDKVRVGAAAVLGKGHPLVKAFDADYPGLHAARNVLEHFDEYLKGAGHMQKKTADADQLHGVRIATKSVADQGSRHHLSFCLIAKGKATTGPYDLDTRAVVESARELCNVVRQTVGDG